MHNCQIGGYLFMFQLTTCFAVFLLEIHNKDSFVRENATGQLTLLRQHRKRRGKCDLPIGDVEYLNCKIFRKEIWPKFGLRKEEEKSLLLRRLQ